MISTVIFDLDGTLLNTLGDLHLAFNYALKTLGYNECSLDEVKSYVGNGIKKAFECAVKDTDTQKLIQLFKEYYIEHLYELTMPYDGIIDLLKNLNSIGYDLAVVSNKYDEAVKELCRHYFKDYINIAVGESETIRRKPSKDGITEALKLLGKDLKSSIYVGDSEVDIMTAKNAGIPCISVLWGFKDKEFLKRNGGNIFAENPSDIIEIIRKGIL